MPLKKLYTTKKTMSKNEVIIAELQKNPLIFSNPWLRKFQFGLVDFVQKFLYNDIVKAKL